MLHCVAAAPFSHKKSQQERLSKSLILTNIFRNSCRKDDDDDERNLVCNDISIYTVSETYIISSRYIYNHSGKIS